MPDKLGVEEILEKNPKVDPKILEELAKLHRHLHEEGFARSGYRLLPPYGGRRVVVGEPGTEDPRTKHVTRRMNSMR